MAAAARELGIDPTELRRRNMVSPARMPYLTPVGKLYDSGDFPNACSTPPLPRWTGHNFSATPRPNPPREARGSSGMGMSYYLEATGGDPTERAEEIRFADDGFVDVFVGTQSSGQGHETAYVMLTADRLGVDGDKVRIFQGGTDAIPTGGGTGGARRLVLRGPSHPGHRRHGDPERPSPPPPKCSKRRRLTSCSTTGRFVIAGTDRGVDIIHARAQPSERRAPPLARI